MNEANIWGDGRVVDACRAGRKRVQRGDEVGWAVSWWESTFRGGKAGDGSAVLGACKSVDLPAPAPALAATERNQGQAKLARAPTPVW